MPASNYAAAMSHNNTWHAAGAWETLFIHTVSLISSERPRFSGGAVGPVTRQDLDNTRVRLQCEFPGEYGRALTQGTMMRKGAHGSAQ